MTVLALLWCRFFVIYSLVVTACHTATVNQQRRFPADFMFGTATAAYQVEGAWNEDGKSESIWDYLIHNNPTVVNDGNSGDIAADSYHNYKRDVEMMRELGVDVHRFSLSWPRILPTGFVNQINSAGIQYYNNFINEMLKYNITPMATLYHWDLPQKLQELGGFSNPLIAGWFEDYSRVAFKHFGDRVKYWITFNEPREICAGYGSDFKAPRLNATGVGTYLCAKHIVLAHANAYHAYNNDFKPTQGGQCGLTISVNWYGPATDSAEDKFAAEIKKQGQWGLYTEPIYSTRGGFPKELAQRIAEKSTQQGYPWSRLPEFTEEEKARARGAYDFFGVNHYTGTLISATKHKRPAAVPSLTDDEDVGVYVPDVWPAAKSPCLSGAPNSICNVLTDLQMRYNNPVMYIKENGWFISPNHDLMDDIKIAYYRATLEGILDALDAGVNLKGYMVWSLLDSFEWTRGYKMRFGLYHVDFKDPARKRTPRKSAFVYKHIIKNRLIDHNYVPSTMNMTIDEGN